MLKQVTEKSTKKDLWDAYQEAIKKDGDSQNPEQYGDIAGKETISGSGEKEKDSAVKDTYSEARRPAASSDPALFALDEARTMVAHAIADFNERAEEARKRLIDERANLERETEDKRTFWKREQEEYEYSIALARRKEEDEYELKIKERERSFNEKFAAKEKDLSEREEAIKFSENELKQLRTQVESFPKQLEKAIAEAANKARMEAEREAKVNSDLSQKDFEREREVAGLKVVSLEETIKRNIAQIVSLERQISQAHEQIQKLAITALESGGTLARTTTQRAGESQTQQQSSQPSRGS